MNTVQYFQHFGLTGARTALENVPDKTTTHLGVVLNDEPTYYSVDFGSYWDNHEWQDSDYGTEAEIAEAYASGWCVNLSELKRLVENVELVEELGGVSKCKGYIQVCFYKGRVMYGERLTQAIADYESIYGGQSR